MIAFCGVCLCAGVSMGLVCACGCVGVGVCVHVCGCTCASVCRSVSLHEAVCLMGLLQKKLVISWWPRGLEIPTYTNLEIQQDILLCSLVFVVVVV